MLSNETSSRAMVMGRDVRIENQTLVCRACHSEASHNEVLRLSYCPIHGFESALDYRATAFRGRSG